jgi:hypothetical protein
MPTLVSKPALKGERKRRVHAKSRKGCGNCKIRRIKVGSKRTSYKIQADHNIVR